MTSGLSEETAVSLVKEIGELTGSVRAHIEAQKAINQNVASRFEEHATQIDSLNESRTKVKGIVVGMGLGGTSLGAALMKFFGMTGGGHP